MEIIDEKQLGRDRVHLNYLAGEALKELDADVCAIFLRNTKNPNSFDLVASIPFSDDFEKNIDLDVRAERSHIESERNVGITYSCIKDNKTLLVKDIFEYEKWSGYGKVDDEINSFGLQPGSAKSLLITPIRYQNEVIGAIRVVRAKSRNTFIEQDIIKLERFTSDVVVPLKEASYLDDLLDIGTALELTEFCQKVVDTIPKLVNGKTTSSIFLLNKKRSDRFLKRFYGLSSTGYFGNKDGDIIPNDIALEEVYYSVNQEEYISKNYTEAVIKKRKVLVIQDGSSNEELQEARARLEIDREIGGGLYGEANKNGELTSTGAMLYLPIFYRDSSKVIGVLRVNKEREPKNKNQRNQNIFSRYEINTLLLFQHRLCRVLGHISFISVLRELLSMDTQNVNRLLEFVAEEVTDIVGGQGCSIFLHNINTNLLEFGSTFGALKDCENIKPYRFGQGYTGWVAKYQRALWFNRKGETKDIEDIEELPKWSGRKNECETGRKTADKFAAVPIISTNDITLGVIRVAKTERETDFTYSDIDIMETIASHLAQKLEESWRTMLDQKVFALSQHAIRNENEENKNIFTFLTFITHEEGLRFNRAIYLDYVSNESKLTGRIGIGPVDESEAKIMQKGIEKKKVNIEISINMFDEVKGLPPSKLQNEMKGLEVEVGYRTCKFSESIEKRSAIILDMTEVDENVRVALEQLNIREFILCPVVVSEKVKGVILVDNLYQTKHGGVKKFVEANLNSLQTVVKLFEIILLATQDMDAMGGYKRPIDNIEISEVNKLVADLQC